MQSYNRSVSVEDKCILWLFHSFYSLSENIDMPTKVEVETVHIEIFFSLSNFPLISAKTVSMEEKEIILPRSSH